MTDQKLTISVGDARVSDDLTLGDVKTQNT